jgi:phage shock protein PspC (stress-responsive transcriptional regulator)
MDTSFANLGLLVVVIWALDRARLDRPSPMFRPVSDRWLSGVCVAIARRLEIDVAFVRVGFLAALWVGAHAIIAYLVLELVIRWDPAEREQLWSHRAWTRLRGAIAR